MVVVCTHWMESECKAKIDPNQTHYFLRSGR